MVDDVLEVLADRHRRQLLLALLTDGSQRVPRPSGVCRELHEADEGLLREHLTSARRIDGADEALLRTIHIHLPRMAEDGFVEWDRDARIVTRGPRFDDLIPHLTLHDHGADEAPPALGVDPQLS